MIWRRWRTDMQRLDGKIAIVTGASRGIGRAVALRLAGEGALVGVNYNSHRDGGEETVRLIEEAGGKAELLHFDVADEAASVAAIETFLQRHDRVDILVNNAGIVHNGLLVRTKGADFNHVLAVNLGGVFHCTRAVTGSMMKTRWGRIVNLTSVVGLTGNAGQAAYSSSKAAIIGFTKSIARELASRNITVNAVAPGFVATHMTAELPDKQRDAILGSIPLARIGTPDEVAGAVLFLTLPEAGYITGHVLDVNGGMLM
jgi:3-oxoacyl-[acyl-carrier protein] reductase